MDDPRIAAKFAACVPTPGPLDTPCLIWPFAHNGTAMVRGYGQVWLCGRIRLAHRIAYEQRYGQIPSSNSYHGVCVLHKCDNPSCVNPDHLCIGSHRQNMLDKCDKGRHQSPRGERNGSRKHPESRPRGEQAERSKITESDVRSIRTRRDCGETFISLAKSYGLGETTVRKIFYGKTWKHVV